MNPSLNLPVLESTATTQELLRSFEFLPQQRLLGHFTSCSGNGFFFDESITSFTCTPDSFLPFCQGSLSADARAEGIVAGLYSNQCHTPAGVPLGFIPMFLTNTPAHNHQGRCY